MIEVYQRNFGGKGSEDPGECYAACIASVMEIGLNDTPRFEKVEDDVLWARYWMMWFYHLGFYALFVDGVSLTNEFLGYTIGTVDLGGTNHSVVCLGGKPIFDPIPTSPGESRSYDPEDVMHHEFLIRFNPAHGSPPNLGGRAYVISRIMESNIANGYSLDYDLMRVSLASRTHYRDNRGASTSNAGDIGDIKDRWR